MEQVHTISLSVLDPEHFPNLAAVRRFVRSGDFAELLRGAAYIVQESSPDNRMGEAPKLACDKAASPLIGLLFDLGNLAEVAVDGKPIEMRPWLGGDNSAQKLADVVRYGSEENEGVFWRYCEKGHCAHCRSKSAAAEDA